MTDVTFVGDEAVVIVSECATSLLRKISKVTSVGNDVFARYGMQVNCAKGKTEATFALRGKGAVAVTSSLYASEASGNTRVVQVQAASGPKIHLNIVENYNYWKVYQVNGI